MTPINTHFEAAEPRTNLDGIPEAFFTWAEDTHGWARSDLLKLGRARGADKTEPTALDVFVQNFVFSAGVGKCVYCNDGTQGLQHNALGFLECTGCSSREYRTHQRRLHFVEAEWIAAGSPDQHVLDIPRTGYCPWDDLRTRLDLARKRFAKWAKSKRNKPPAQHHFYLGLAYPD